MLLFAVEGLNWDLLLPAMRAGRAPNLLDLARRGSATRLSREKNDITPTTLGIWPPELRAAIQPVTTAAEQTAAEAIIKQRHPRVMAIYQGALDAAIAGQPESDLAAVLEGVDAGFGRLRALMPPATDIIVVSDDAPDGVWIAAGPSFRAPKPPFHLPDRADQLPRLGDDESPGVLNILPTILHIRGMAAAEGTDGQVMTQLLIGGSSGLPPQSGRRSPGHLQ